MLLPLSVSCSKVSLLSKLSARAWQLDKAEAHSKDTILHKITRRFIHLKCLGRHPKPLTYNNHQQPVSNLRPLATGGSCPVSKHIQWHITRPPLVDTSPPRAPMLFCSRTRHCKLLLRLRPSARAWPIGRRGKIKETSGQIL